MYDVIVIGAGPAGISAAIYAVSRGCKTLVLEQSHIGGTIHNVSTVTHYSGIIEQETGFTFAKRLEEQAKSAGVTIVFEKMTDITLQGEVKTIKTEKNTYHSKKVILANGTSPRKLGIIGEEELHGKGIGLNAAKDASAYTGRHVYVIGGADGAVKEALYLSNFASKVTIVHFEETLGCIAEFRNKVENSTNIDVCLNTRLHAVYGSNYVESLDLLNEKDGKLHHLEDPGCGIFVYAGSVPNTQLYTDLKLQNGFIIVNENQQTSIPGVYAAGDICVKQVRQIATAVSDGAIAGIHAAAY